MTISTVFEDFIGKLSIGNANTISDRYGEVTASLNKKFRGTDSKTANSLKVGSIGRYTAINGISDLDMLYIMPKGLWSEYKDGKQYQLLCDAKDAIKGRYPKTKVFIDRLVVCVQYTNFYIEVQPVFEQDDESFKYPDSYDGGIWKTTKPREEIKAISSSDSQTNGNLRRLCKMARAWKNKHGIGMGGLLIDTLAYNFLKSTAYYDDKGYGFYDVMSRDFFEYLMNQPNQDYYAALGSNQRVRVKKKFQRKAKKAYELCIKAIEASEKDIAYGKWKKIYGRPFPSRPITNIDASSFAQPTWRNTEQFIEDLFSIDIRHNITIDCDVSQDGFREHKLSDFLRKNFRLARTKDLSFYVKEHDINGKYSIYWKVLNRGDEARRRDIVRGQIFPDLGFERNKEHTNFRGEHIVECYAVKDNVVIAKDRIDVPIE
ncbi:nucleotidyltransferase [Nodosilinea sp. LEGE 07088]|uniref:nucleotide-binding domain-containing protein n=1 Tax=Nodosilinea sp. LEGE 07088 TaxID=2777968 RepID=UPI00187ED395|nr:nucleotidyltransferase [Nodosilinea sp. LEGE 07088]MBE9136182.1 nucleotidyltransferase [Nodosilinea sp. LEGE 07088]